MLKTQRSLIEWIGLKRKEIGEEDQTLKKMMMIWEEKLEQMKKKEELEKKKKREMDQRDVQDQFEWRG